MKLYNILMSESPADTFRDMDRDSMLEEFPEVWRLRSCLELEKWHPEGNTFEHTMLVLSQMQKVQGKNFLMLLAALVHDFGKAAVPRDKMPKYHGHAAMGVPIVDAFCQDHGVHPDFIDIVKFVTKYHMHMHDITRLRPVTFDRMFQDAKGDVYIHTLYNLGVADTRGRLGHDQDDVSHLHILLDKYQDWKIKGNIFRA